MMCHPYILHEVRCTNTNEIAFLQYSYVVVVIYMYLIRYSIDCQEKRTPLHWAAKAGSVECVKELMQHADIGRTVIMQDDVSYYE